MYSMRVTLIDFLRTVMESTVVSMLYSFHITRSAMLDSFIWLYVLVKLVRMTELTLLCSSLPFQPSVSDFICIHAIK
jgi:hypothetical protein